MDAYQVKKQAPHMKKSTVLILALVFWFLLLPYLVGMQKTSNPDPLHVYLTGLASILTNKLANV